MVAGTKGERQRAFESSGAENRLKSD
jgi:hypothetical protein